MNEWRYEGQPFTDPGTYWGFVYQLKNLETGKLYIGKKFFTRSKIRQVKKKRKRSRIDSGWQDYYSSSKTVLEEVEKYGKDRFERTILHLCKNRAECSYYESYEILKSHALLDSHYYNDWLSCRIRRKHLNTLQF